MRIFIVDDEVQIGRSLRRLLVRRGHIVAAFTSAEDALEEIDASPPDAVLTDFQLPGADGVDLLARVQSLAPGARRLLMSGFADLDGSSRDRAPLVVHEFLRKPCSVEDVLHALLRPEPQ